jgi:hypothetical protein
MSMKNFSDNKENRTRDLPVRNAVPQPTAPSQTSKTLSEDAPLLARESRWLLHNAAPPHFDAVFRTLLDGESP